MSQAQSSPRLPSPPPPAEIQLGPTSPGLNNGVGLESQERNQATVAANAKRRIHVGTKAEDMAAGPPLIPFSELESAFSSQEHLAALHYYHTSSNTTPINRQTALSLATPPAGVERTLWLYELCRFLIAQCNGLIVGFLFDTPPCSSATCPEMRASEWQFLCAVHEAPKSCCAIDYCCHTLDWAANIVTNPKIFPSRIVLGADSSERSSVLKNLVNVFRRLHRIFAHAWFQHRGPFWSVEAQTGLYVFFKTVCDVYDLLPAENYKLPPEAEGLESASVADKEEKRPPVAVLAKPPAPASEGGAGEGGGEDDKHNFHARRTNTARHSSRPSVGSIVTTVIEEREDEQFEMAAKLGGMRISPPETVDEEDAGIEVPVVVETSADAGDGSPQYGKPTEVFGAAASGDNGFPGIKIDVQEDVPVEPDTPPTTDDETASNAPTVVTDAESIAAKDDDEDEEEEEGEEEEEDEEEEVDEEEEEQDDSPEDGKDKTESSKTAKDAGSPAEEKAAKTQADASAVTDEKK